MLILLGLIQKVYIGDTLGRAVDPVYAQALVKPVAASDAWLALVFAFQVFFDFAGYSDCAIGIALIFGVRLPLNFDAPYRATSIRDFWRRWHMTLSRFLRDYIYIPLGGSHFGLSRQVAALLITMSLCGLWHGAGWTFVAWGVVHGVALVTDLLWRRYLPALPALLGWLLTFVFVVLTFVLFRAESWQAAWNIYAGLLGWPENAINRKDFIYLAFFVAVVLPPSHEICRRLMVRPRTTVSLAASATMVVMLLLLAGDANRQFIYFQF
jgi:D-alanyl-lipoteichoic acid acyltransferase DltB (MBOAT superfamily)